MYGAPVWHREIGVGRAAAPLAAVQRLVGSRVVRAYRTTALEFVRVLARIPPVDLLADEYVEVYAARQAALGRARETGRDLNPEEIRQTRLTARKRTMLRWQRRLEDPLLPGQRVRKAVGLVLQDWMERPYLCITFRSTQVVTRHGVFGAFLHRIGRVPTPECEHCEVAVDTAAHTLEKFTK
ncbi:uncharacterized protein LOC109859934 [Pseudomyrmex gracilis]|uniref:uncharacterized protein LOC109859934 n=1 Tax=Pseudomyrmex gracilis TaxID=219809 RepID=UPI0009959B15|nr:uncharacterized protein LOC109859934 [Pseudomyrmex gracilis]